MPDEMLEIICNQMSTADLGRFASTSKRVRDVCTAILVARRAKTIEQKIMSDRLTGLFNYRLIKDLIWFDVERHVDHPTYSDKMKVSDGYFGYRLKFRDEYVVIVLDYSSGILRIYDVLATSTRYLQDILNAFLTRVIAMAVSSGKTIKRIEFHIPSAYKTVGAIERVAWARKQYKNVVGLIRILREFAESHNLEFDAKINWGLATSKIRDRTWEGYQSDG